MNVPGRRYHFPHGRFFISLRNSNVYFCGTRGLCLIQMPRADGISPKVGIESPVPKPPIPHRHAALWNKNAARPLRESTSPVRNIQAKAAVKRPESPSGIGPPTLLRRVESGRVRLSPTSTILRPTLSRWEACGPWPPGAGGPSSHLRPPSGDGDNWAALAGI